jgi:hypothetical protein
MSLSQLNSGFQDFDDLEGLSLLDDAIANASQRRSIFAKQDDALPEILAEEANSIIGGLPAISVFNPPITIGLIANDPLS